LAKVTDPETLKELEKTINVPLNSYYSKSKK